MRSDKFTKCLVPADLKVDYPKVPSKFNHTPALAIANLKEKLLHPYLKKHYPHIYNPAKAAFNEPIASRIKNIEKIVEPIRYLPAAYLRKVFCDWELIALKSSTCITVPNELEEVMSQIPCFYLWDKVVLSSWHMKYRRLRWNTFIKFLNAIQRLDFGPDFSFEMDFTTGCNSLGYSCVKRYFIDGEIGLFLTYKGKHVLTISFNVIEDTQPKLIMEQVQLVNKKGNRFLFKLGASYLESITAKVYKAFKGFQFFIPTSGRVIPRIQNGYIRGMGTPGNSWYAEIKAKLDEFNTSAKHRVAAFYDQPFSSFCKMPTEDNYWHIQKA